MDKLRKVIKVVNMRAISEEANISYAILKNFSIGKKKQLTKEEAEAVTTAIKELTNLE